MACQINAGHGWAKKPANKGAQPVKIARLLRGKRRLGGLGGQDDYLGNMPDKPLILLQIAIALSIRRFSLGD
jgi:hypothetical protein